MTAQRPHSPAWHLQPDIADLSPDSYTAQRLQHATPEHLHLTARRFFIGPIPEGWLNKNRRDWYRHHLNFNYSTRAATFSSPNPREERRRRLSGISGPSSTALFQHSFPQPEELSADESAEEGPQERSRGHGEPAPKGIAAEGVKVPRASYQKDDVVTRDEVSEYADAPSDVDEEPGPTRPPTVYVDAPSEADGELRTELPTELRKFQDSQDRKMSDLSFTTASSRPAHDLQAEEAEEASTSRVPMLGMTGQSEPGRISPSNAGSTNGGPSEPFVDAPSVEAVSTTSLLPKTDVTKGQAAVALKPPSRGVLSRVKRRSKTATDDSADLKVTRTRSNLRNLVKFDVPEDSKRAELHLRAKSAQMTLRHASTRLRRQKLKDGLILKMERMLVRVDRAGTSVPNDFDENVDQKVDSRVKDKWREYMVVCRQSISDEADFVLQLYKTRVIPEIEQQGATRKATFEVKLERKKTRVNLYSSLDKSVTVWRPFEGGTQIFIMQARTASNAVEWYTFLQNTMGFHRTRELQINIPDLSLTLRIGNPFERLEASQSRAQFADGTNEEVVMRAMEEEQKVAQDLIRQCLDQLKDSPEWADVLDSWVSNQRIGLAWKRYDRLEWVHGANERKMYGTIAMQRSHDLELRPKSHYPTTAVTRKKHKTLTEPVPVEGFLIRLTGNRGRAKRLGLMYHKQLYFASHDQFLIFSRPPKTTPPPPPRLPTARNGQVPAADVIAEQAPDTWAVDPYPLTDNNIEWLQAGHTGTPESRRLHDGDAEDEAERKLHNLLNCDGYVNLADIKKVRKAKKGASPVDEDVETSGSDVDFDEEVDDTMGEDGATKEFDMERTFELVMRNGLIIRLQAADKARRKEWIKHLRALAKYWRHRTASDISMYKSTRAKNLAALNIDEEAEAYVGQFAKKWEVTQSYASPQLYNLCGIAGCRSVHMSGMLYRKPRIHAPFTRCSVILAGGTLLIFQDVLRSKTGKRLPHIHHDRIANLDLKDCYIYSGLLTDSDLLYQNQTFDANKPGHHALPRIYLEDGWTSTDEDVMTTFVVWHGKSKSWFRAEEGQGTGGEQRVNAGARHRLKRVAKLGSKGRSVVFRARSRVERDHWVLAIQNEIEKANRESGQDFRIEEAKPEDGGAGDAARGEHGVVEDNGRTTTA